MRDDETKDTSFQENDVWGRQKYTNEVIIKSNKNPEGEFVGGRAFTTNSLSGKERNRTFVRSGDNFADLSLISGTDDVADGRSFALIDFNNDGWQDIALMSLNAPRFKLFENKMGEQFPDRNDVKLKLVGGQTQGKASAEWSNRDGVGARVLVKFSGEEPSILMQCQAGEGFAGQNSRMLRVAVGSGRRIDSIQVTWPSGKITQRSFSKGDIDSPIVFYENPQESSMQ